jgi:hypothetical protein
MKHSVIAESCPWRVPCRKHWHCKALLGQPNKSRCIESNCAPLYIARQMADSCLTETHRLNKIMELKAQLNDITFVV